MSRRAQNPPTRFRTQTELVAAQRRALRDAKSRLTAVRKHRQKKLDRAQAAVDHEASRIADIDARLARVDLAGRVLDHGWDAWQPDPNAPAYRSTPLPRGALSAGALRVLRQTGRPMTSKEIAVAVFLAHGFPPPPPTMLGEIAVQITKNLACKDGVVVRRDRRWGGHVWSIIPIEEIRERIRLTKI